MRISDWSSDVCSSYLHGCVGGMVHARERQLPFGRRRTAQRADLAVRPVLLGDPAQCVVTVGLRQAENFILAFGEIAAAFILHDEHIADRKSTRLNSSH